MMVSEALKTVDRINDDLLDLIPEDNFENCSLMLLVYKFIGYEEFIEYLGITIWDSENDGYEWNETIQDYDYSKFEPYIRAKINEINKFIGNIKI
jgi:hypothetical protein